MKPKNKTEALELVHKLSKEFNFEYLVIDDEVFKDEAISDVTKDWTDAQFRRAQQLLNNELCETSFYSVSNIIDIINRG